MEIRYSQHLLQRLLLRQINTSLPRQIFENANERFEDTETGHFIAVGRETLYGKQRDIMVAYHSAGTNVKLLTIHPLKEGQKEQRVASGRWRRIP